MKKGLFFTKCFIALLLLFLFCFKIVLPQYTDSYQASLVDKVARLSSIDVPKIILIGNSNVAFGFNSPRLEELTGMPVVNMGLHGGVGNAFNEQSALIHTNPGDIVILCNSSYNDDDLIENPELAWITIENHHELWPYIRQKDISPMVNAFPTYFRKSLSMWAREAPSLEDGSIYSRSIFNEYGDVSLDRPGLKDSVDFSSVAVSTVSTPCVNRINELDLAIKEKGATLLLASHPIAYHDGTPSPEEYDAFKANLTSQITAPFISNHADYFFPTEYFYDSYLHLSTEGALLRTEQLAKDLYLYWNSPI